MRKTFTLTAIIVCFALINGCAAASLVPLVYSAGKSLTSSTPEPSPEPSPAYTPPTTETLMPLEGNKTQCVDNGRVHYFDYEADTTEITKVDGALQINFVDKDTKEKVVVKADPETGKLPCAY